MHALFGIDLLDNGSGIHVLINEQGNIFDGHTQVGDFAQEVFHVIVKAGRPARRRRNSGNKKESPGSTR